MSFLSPWLLYGFSVLAVPVLIHLWQRKRVVQIPFSTLRFLKIVAARTKRSSKLENLLLLLLRCLLFALVIAAAARPVASTDATKLFGGSVPRTIALVIDQSMSMSYKSGDETRLEHAKRQAQAVIDDLQPGDEVAVIGVSDRARLFVAQPTVDHGVARQAFNAIQPTEAKTDFSIGLREARNAVGKAARGMKQIFLFTDGQATGWQFNRAAVFDEAWKKTDPQLIVVRTDESIPMNAAVSQVRFDTPFAAPGLMTRGIVKVENYSAATLRDLLEIKIGTDKVVTKPVEVAAGTSVELPFEFQMTTMLGRWALGTASLAGDNLAADDVHYFTLSIYQTPRVLMVESGAGPEKTRPGFFLRKALAVGTQGAPIKTISPPELDDLPVEPFSAVFLAGLPSLSDRSAVRLDRYLESGGTVVFFPSDQTDLPAIARLEWMPAKPERVRDLPAERLVTRAIEPQHPLFTNSWDANTPFPALPQRKLIDWKLGSDARVLLTLGENLPFIIFGQRGAGQVIVINASPDRAWGDFPLTSAFLPLVQQIARLSMTRAGRETTFVVGDPVPAPPSLPRDQPLTLKLPRGELAAVPAGAPLLERAEAAGFYEVTSPAEGLLHQFAVNVDSTESDLTPMNDDALKQIVSHESIVGSVSLRIWLAQSRGLMPLWPLLLVLALGAFAAESLYSNLLARRRAQGEEKHIKTGRLNKRRLGQPFRAAENVENLVGVQEKRR